MAVHDASSNSAEGLRLRKITDESQLALEHLRNAARVLRDGDAFAPEVFAAMCSVAAVLNAVRAAAEAQARPRSSALKLVTS